MVQWLYFKLSSIKQCYDNKINVHVGIYDTNCINLTSLIHVQTTNVCDKHAKRFCTQLSSFLPSCVLLLFSWKPNLWTSFLRAVNFFLHNTTATTDRTQITSTNAPQNTLRINTVWLRGVPESVTGYSDDSPTVNGNIFTVRSNVKDAYSNFNIQQCSSIYQHTHAH